VVLEWAEYQAELEAALQAETSPYQAVCAPGHIWLPGLIAKGQLAAFEPLLDKLPDNVQQAYNTGDWMPSVAAEARFDGKTYLLPIFTDGHLLFFNKAYVDLADGATVSPLALDALASEARLPAGAHALALKAHPSEIFLDWLPYLWAAGGEVIDANGLPGFAGPAGIEALEYYVSLKRFCPPQTDGYGNGEIAAALSEGRVALAASWGGQAAVIFSGKANLGVALFPHPWNTTWGVSLPANQSEAAQLSMLERLIPACGQDLDHEVTRIAGSPVRLSSYSAEECARYPWLAAQHEMLGKAKNLPSDPRLGGFLGDLYGAVFKAFTGQMTPEKALKQVEAKAARILIT
jgi:multiple sugar transport system substrate-binding protein